MLVGDVGLTTVSGYVGLGIRLGERWLDGHGEFQHAFVVVDTSGRIVEAEPGGARLAHVSEYATHRLAFASEFGIVPDVGERALIATEALHLLGTPYSFLDYVALALHRADEDGDGRLTRWAHDRVHDSGHMICSELAATAQYAAPSLRGLYGPSAQDVTPGDMIATWRRHGGP